MLRLKVAAALAAGATTILVACTSSDPKAIAAPSTRERIKVAGWTGAAFPLEGGPFTRCVIRGRYGRLPAMFFFIDNTFRLTFGVESSEWSLEQFARYPAVYSVDGGAIHGAEALATRSSTGTSLIFIGPIELGALGQFRDASSLDVAAAGFAYRFDLRGSAAAFDALRDCASHHGPNAGGPTTTSATSGGTGRVSDGASEGSDRATNPFAMPGDDDGPHERAESAPSEPQGGSNPFAPRGGAGPERPSTGGGGSGIESRDAPGSQFQHTAPDAIAAARRFVERLLTEAGIADYRILVGPEAPADKGDVDVVWRVGDQIGTLRIVEPRRYPSVVEASAAIVRDASLICNEGFTSSIAARKLRDGRPAAQMSVACTRPLTWHANYTVVPVKGAGYYRINLTSFADTAEIDALHERIGRALPRLVPEG